LDLNCLLHRHQTALIGVDAGSSSARREAAAVMAAEIGAVITRRQRELGATFSLVEVVR
jgi:hypothetical protein